MMRPRSSKIRQHGVVLWISLMVLVILLAAAVVIVRNTSLGQSIAGNLGFKKNATLAGDQGIEAARAWLLTKNREILESDSIAEGYYASWGGLQDDPALFNWDNDHSVESDGGAGSGNRVRYIIHRMCRLPGKTSGLVGGVLQECVYDVNIHKYRAEAEEVLGSLSVPIYPFYRVTSRVDGPRNTVSYVQSILY